MAVQGYSGAGDRRLAATVLQQVANRKIAEILSDSGTHGGTLARLARLRRAAIAEPGSVPEVWDDTIGALPEELWSSHDEPSDAERSIHLALTLFAIYAQGGYGPIQSNGVSLGGAARRFDREGVERPVSPVRVRMNAISTAQSHEARAHHLRSLITLMRGSHVPMDFGRLAVDLFWLMKGEKSADSVRLAWGRDLLRLSADGAHHESASSASDVDLDTEHKSFEGN